MFIAYFDESGDDGYPRYSSELFVLTSVYLHYSNWQECYRKFYDFRKHLRATYRFPVKQEFHTREFITDKSPYHGKYSTGVRKKILFEFCSFAATLEVKVVSVVIDKQNIRRPNYHVLKNALTYNVQRIENDLALLGNVGKFMIITDEGRVGAMRNVTRKIQKINYIPSQFNQTSYRKEITSLLEDPLPKNSDQSYFVQLADMIAFIVTLYARQNLCKNPVAWGKRTLQVLQPGDEVELLRMMKPILNTKASASSEFGVVYYPKK